MLFFSFFTKLDEMSRVGSKGQHPKCRPKKDGFVFRKIGIALSKNVRGGLGHFLALQEGPSFFLFCSAWFCRFFLWSGWPIQPQLVFVQTNAYFFQSDYV